MPLIALGFNNLLCEGSGSLLVGFLSSSSLFEDRGAKGSLKVF